VASIDSPSGGDALTRVGRLDGFEDGDLAQKAYQAIRAAILDLSFQPGQQLQESFLAQWLGTSRTPVREAIRRLASEGLIEFSSSRRVVVAQVSVADVENAYFVIEVLEGLASCLAAERLNAEGAASLRRLFDRMSSATVDADMDSWIKVDAELHDTIRVIAANPKLSQTANLVYPIIERVRNTFLRDGSEPDRLAVATEDHGELVNAILASDPALAENSARRLFAKAREDNVRLLQRWVAPLRRSF
jgi:DNA-binding GntR family transcriptional regulator